MPGSVAAMLKNLVYLELLRRGCEVNVGKIGSAEIDFMASKQENKLHIQIAERIESEETEAREYIRQPGIADNYLKCVLYTIVLFCFCIYSFNSPLSTTSSLWPNRISNANVIPILNQS